MTDLVITGGHLHDGTGAPAQRRDIAVADGRVSAIEADLSAVDSREVIDATGRIITPGFVDIHTHFDGQVTWDEVLEPATSHGVTTVVMGNCGVGFAPVRPGAHQRLVELMEGVEDIPGSALAEGIEWAWETFPQYLDALEKRRWSVDVATQVPHGPLRTYVRHEQADGPATAGELDEMARLAREAVEAGAFGVTTSRTFAHKAVDGTPVPGTFADIDELTRLAGAVRDGGGRILEVAPAGLARSDDDAFVAAETQWMGKVAAEADVTVTFIMLQAHNAPDRWRLEMEAARQCRAEGARVFPLVASRSAAVLYGWDTRHPFLARPSYRPLAQLPLPERLEALGNPSTRARILEESDDPESDAQRSELRFLNTVLGECFALVDPIDYEQPVESALGALANRQGCSVHEVAYDVLMEPEAMLRYPLYNYASGDHSVLHEQLADPETIVSLGDAGAHCAFICDASMPTYLLTHWGRDRTRGPRLQLPELVRRLTSQPAELYGLDDRGTVEVGKRADLNIIDFENLNLPVPRAVHDLPAGGTRLIQPATGYDATVVGGTVTRRHGADTGARPGRLLRRG
jgi:N-acyl-D-amino-acid deacylase